LSSLGTARLRVAFVVGRFPVVSETFVLNQATGLLDRGHDVDILAVDGPAPPRAPHHPDVSRYGMLARTRVVPTASGRIARLLKGVALHAAHAHRDPAMSARALVALADRTGGRSALMPAIPLLGRTPYDVVHCQFGVYGERILPLYRSCRIGRRLVVSFRGYDISEELQRRGCHVYDDLLRAADAIVTNCEYFHERLLGLGAPASRVEVLPSGVDCDKFPFRPRRFPEDRRLRIASVGRLIEKKGFEYAIAAVAMLVHRRPDLDVQYEIVGEGPLHEALVRASAARGCADHVRLSGPGDEAAIRRLLDRSHLFLAPSVTACTGNEDAPLNTLKEAMASGLPVISTRHGGIPELITDGVDGYLVPERDGDALAERLLHLVHHPESWPALGRAGRLRVETGYDLRCANDRLVEIYRQALLRPSAAAGVAMEIAPTRRRWLSRG
jgi:colanic acid/amylovoran biosynthesis glycosyltransferase